MSHWDYRVIEFESEGEKWRAIHEVQNDESGKSRSYSEPAASISTDVVVGRGSMRWTLDRMREALDKPVLHASDFQDGG